MEEKKKQTVIEIFESEKERLQRELTAMEGMIDYINKQTAILHNISTHHQESYNPNATYPEKILYVLKVKGECLTKDIVQYIKDNEPNLDEKTKNGLSLNIGKAAQRLADDKRIKVTKVGNSNKYSLS